MIDVREAEELIAADPELKAPVPWRHPDDQPTPEPTETALVEWIPCDPAQSRAPLRYIPEDQLKYGIR